MAMPPPTFTPEELALLPHDDRGPALIATSWSLTCLATIFLGLRVYCKTIGRRGLWWDDWILIAAWVVLVIDSGLATHMVVYYTYGRHSWDFRPPNVDTYTLVVTVRATFTVTAIAWTKTAFAITLLRLVDSGWMKKVLWVILVTMNLALGLTALFFWIRCTPVAMSWTPSMEGTCWFNVNMIKHYNAFSGAYSAAADFILALLPWKLLIGLQMRRKEKLGAAVAMSMGFLAGIAAIVKTVKLPKLASEDLYDAVDLVIWDITEAAVSMIGACIPVLRVLLRDVKLSGRGTSSRYHMEGSQQLHSSSDRPWPEWKGVGGVTGGATVASGPVSKGFVSPSLKAVAEDDDGSEKHILIMGTGEAPVVSRPSVAARGDTYELGRMCSV
ncbi:putative integral membrane protein [Apodospora peruviana]|uniref:Integral membrane protein n=1 Tax=Apodospora peruviana TaxID=516989 RepID=A0AAE0I3K7_9PEZI|nr:putative integral membrane protein [Apodospora peruviana]